MSYDSNTVQTVYADKFASSTKHFELPHELEVASPTTPKAGDLIVVQTLTDNSSYNQLELVSGRLARIKIGDVIVGVLGKRRALKGFVGDIPKGVKAGDKLSLLNLGGLVGKCTGRFHGLGRPIRVEVLGCVVQDNRVLNITEKALPPVDSVEHTAPFVLVAGTSMSVGKTQVVAELIKQFSRNGYRAMGAKLSGVAALRDPLNMEDHGAVKTMSFIDCGLPSTVGLKDLGPLTRTILHHLNQDNPDVIVVEMGDGLIGGYNVDSIFQHEDIMSGCAATVLCASDFVGAWGGIQQLALKGVTTTVVSGPTTDSPMATKLIKKRFETDAANAINEGEVLFQMVEAKVKEWKESAS